MEKIYRTFNEIYIVFWIYNMRKIKTNKLDKNTLNEDRIFLTTHNKVQGKISGLLQGDSAVVAVEVIFIQ